MDNSRMLQRNGRITNLSSFGPIPHYNRTAAGDCQCRGEQRVRESERRENCNTCGYSPAPKSDNCTPCGEKCTYLAVSSVKMQKWCDIYELDKGYCRGTIFSQLDLPFCGMRGGRL